MERVILHSDLNGFYASVECLYNPDIRDRPVAVGGNVENRHGIILAKNEHAKKYKIKTGEAIWQAKQKCPDLITVPPHFERYLYFSQAAREIYQRYTDKVESFGLDECWLDVSGSTKLFGTGEKIANEIRTVMKKELGLSVSVGVSWNKIFAKLGSDIKKPDAQTLISKDNYKHLVWNLPAEDLLYVGRATSKKLSTYGIYKIGDIATLEKEHMQKLLGKWGEILWLFANGYDGSPVATSDAASIIKSVGNSMTTPLDIKNEEDAKRVIIALSDSVATRLRESGLRGKTVQISIRDTNLHIEEHQAKLTNSSNICDEIAKAAIEILKMHYKWYNPLRSLGVRVCDLVSADGSIQLDIFNNAMKRDRLEKLEHTVDNIRYRFGFNAIQKAILLHDKLTGNDSPITHTIHPVSFMR